MEVKMTSIVYATLLLGSFLFLVWKKDDTEAHFHLKIIGYFVLGSFALNFNQISIPLGFIAYLLFFRPKQNVRVKRIATVFGVLAFMLIYWILPYCIHKWESRPIFIEHKLGSIYTMDFNDEYELIKQELKLKNTNLVLEDFEMDYVKDGRITEVSWQLLKQNGDSYNRFQIQYDFNKSRYRVMNKQLDSWLQYNRLIDADRFFENLNVLNIKDITHSKGDFSSYIIKSSGERVIYEMKTRTIYIVSNEKIQSLDDEQLPVKCYYISTFAMKKTGEERDEQENTKLETFEGTEISDYLFDVEFERK